MSVFFSSSKCKKKIGAAGAGLPFCVRKRNVLNGPMWFNLSLLIVFYGKVEGFAVLKPHRSVDYLVYCFTTFLFSTVPFPLNWIR